MFNQNADYYPTPSALIRKMLVHIDFKKIKTVLEPSAGKCDLVEGIIKQFEYNQSNNKGKYDIDTIEIDDNLQHIIKGKGFRLVHDDFLSYESYKKYDAIIANFPFSQGDKHLLKAIEMQQQGGEIVCLLNADTLLNPYSNSRKELIRQLEDHNAKVEYIENAFLDSERKTGVTVALIYIDIPKIEYNSVILNELKQEEASKTDTRYTSDKLINSDFIKGIVEQYSYEIKAGLKLIHEYNSLKPLMLGSFKDNSNPVLKLSLEYEDKEGSSLENAYIKQIRSKYWKTLFSNDQFMGLFTSNLRRKYMEQVEELKNYDFSLYNIYSLRIQISKEMTQGVEETILNLFEEFSHKHHYYDEQSKNILHFNGWKTNKSYKVNHRVIIPLNGFNNWWNGEFDPLNYNVVDKLKDVEKVFNYLDGGLTEEIDLMEGLKFAKHYGQTKKIELKYFYVTFYKKQTCHLEFKNMELLKKFNLFAAKNKMWIPNNFGKATYNQMSKEEREVVDSFCGKEEYNDILNNTDYYLYEPSETLLLTEKVV